MNVQFDELTQMASKQHSLGPDLQAKAEPKNYNEAMEESCWIEAMQEEIHEFERLEARLVAKGFRQEERIDFEESFALVPRVEASRSDSKLHYSHDDHPITKLFSTTDGEYKFRMEVPDAMISGAIKKKAGYKYYMAKKMESEKTKIVDEPEEKHVSSFKSGRGKGFMCYGDQVANVPNKIKKDDVPMKTRSLTIPEEAVVDIDKDENHILRPSTVAIAKKFKELIQKDELTIANFEDLSNKEKYTTSITKHYAVRYYKEGIEDRIPERWSKEVRHYHFEALNGIHHWEENRINFFKAGLSALTEGNIFSDLRIKSTVRIDLSEVQKFSDGTLVKIQENMIDMLSKNKLGSSNKRLKGREQTDYDIKSSREMLKKIDKILIHREHLRRLEEYV
uniref:Uncharacterized protein n=1 Tax=Tanacetum cinerariifolium TaxID=118510 RepID=A0A6L2NR33_TANCI|nr:hypothetical protein [Tanacetum cinerariifolium]